MIIDNVYTVVMNIVYYCIIQGAGLGAMASLLTYGNKKFESLDTQMRKLIPPLYSLSHELVPLVDADSAAFNQFMVCIVDVLIAWLFLISCFTYTYTYSVILFWVKLFCLF